MKYNSIDHVWYCTNAQRLDASDSILADASKDTAKFYEVDTTNSYIVFNGAWYAM